MLLVKLFKAEVTPWDNDDDYMLYYRTANDYRQLGGVSLGEYRIIFYPPTVATLRHEYGHTKQSRMLGWFYLFVIGLPSLIGNLLCRIIDFDYYKQPWEAWADKLGGVVR